MKPFFSVSLLIFKRTGLVYQCSGVYTSIYGCVGVEKGLVHQHPIPQLTFLKKTNHDFSSESSLVYSNQRFYHATPKEIGNEFFFDHIFDFSDLRKCVF